MVFNDLKSIPDYDGKFTLTEGVERAKKTSKCLKGC